MIEHIVMWRIRSDVTKEQIAQLADAVHAMNGHIDGVRDVVFRASFTTDRNKGYTHVLRCYMDSADVLPFYAAHPLHVRVKDLVATLKEDDGVLCVDIDL